VMREVAAERRATGGQELNSHQKSSDKETNESAVQKSGTEQMNQLLTTPPQLAVPSLVSQKVGAGFLDGLTDKNSASDLEYQPPNKKMKQTLHAAQQQAQGYANGTINSFIQNTKGSSRDDSRQLLAAMWMEIVELRGVGPEGAKFRQSAAMAETVVKEERKAAARFIIEPLNGLSDTELLSIQMKLESAWRHFASMRGSDDSTCTLL